MPRREQSHNLARLKRGSKQMHLSQIVARLRRRMTTHPEETAALWARIGRLCLEHGHQRRAVQAYARCLERLAAEGDLTRSDEVARLIHEAIADETPERQRPKRLVPPPAERNEGLEIVSLAEAT